MPTKLKPVVAEKTHPIIEIYGPTIQGEGPDAGRVCFFLRTGGCDYLCSWCDSLFAVEPRQVRANSTRMTDKQIVKELEGLPNMSANYVVISGGNPALHELGPLVSLLQSKKFQVAVETQGSRWKPWLAQVDRLVVSPKPPSSGMVSDSQSRETANFMEKALHSNAPIALKIVVFDEYDYEWALDFHMAWMPDHPIYLSVGTPQQQNDPDTKKFILDAYRWLCEKVAMDERAWRAIPQAQSHVLAWGTMRGV